MFARSLAVALCLTAPAAAEDITLRSLRAGTAIQGAKPTADDLKGRVVLVEFWGIN
jgi:hypothetical protein